MSACERGCHPSRLHFRENLGLVMEIPEPPLEVAKGGGEAAGKTAERRGSVCHSWGRSTLISAACLGLAPLLVACAAPAGPARRAASLLGDAGHPLPSGERGGVGRPVAVAHEPRAHRSLCPSHPEKAVRAGQGLLREDQDEEVKEETLVQAPGVSFPAWRWGAAGAGDADPPGWRPHPPWGPGPALRPPLSSACSEASPPPYPDDHRGPASPASFRGLPRCPPARVSTFWPG